ncbi:MAG: alpha/beta hydrolase fold domain-containing protein [Armatimonadota bacterium]
MNRFLPLLALIVLLTGCHAQPAIQTDVIYGTAAGEDLKLDIYPCATPGPHPAVLLIHGGGWAAGDKSSDKAAGTALSRRGVVCFSINYRLAPKHPHPAQVLDCARAARWVRANAAKYDVDPSRLAAWGGSAGGHLSLMLGVIKPDDYQSPDDPNRAQSAKVTCVVDYFGPSDLRGVSISPQASSIVKNFIGATAAEAPDKYADASPITRASKDACPVLFVHGDKDLLVPLRQSELMKAALDECQVENELIVVKNGAHGFNGADRQDIMAARVKSVEWLLAHLK